METPYGYRSPTALTEYRVSFPVKIMVMRDGGHQGFGNRFSNRDAERHMHRYGQGVFNDKQIDGVLLDKFFELHLQQGFERLNHLGGR